MMKRPFRLKRCQNNILKVHVGRRTRREQHHDFLDWCSSGLTEQVSAPIRYFSKGELWDKLDSNRRVHAIHSAGEYWRLTLPTASPTRPFISIWRLCLKLPSSGDDGVSGLSGWRVDMMLQCGKQSTSRVFESDRSICNVWVLSTCNQSSRRRLNASNFSHSRSGRGD